MRLATKLVLLILLAGLAGCNTFQEKKRENTLDSTLSNYHTAMRWGHWESLISMRSPKAPKMPEVDLDNVRVTGYELRQPPVEIEKDKVVQVVQIDYVLRDRQQLRKLRDNQEWRYDPETKLWSLFSPFPDFQ